MRLVKEGLPLQQYKKDPSKNAYKKEDRLPLDLVDKSFAAKTRLKRLGALEKPQERNFRGDVREFVTRFVERLSRYFLCNTNLFA